MNQWFGALMIITTAAALPLVSLAGKVSQDTTPTTVIEQVVTVDEALTLATTTTE